MLALGAISAATLVVGGGTLALLQPGLRDSRLSGAARDLFQAVARALLDGTLPQELHAQEVALRALLDRIDALVANLPPHAQSELSQLLSLLTNAGGRRAFAALAQPWPAASVPEVQRALQAMRVSGISLRRQAYQALHDIVAGAYFADAGAWTILGYPGPLEI